MKRMLTALAVMAGATVFSACSENPQDIFKPQFDNHNEGVCNVGDAPFAYDLATAKIDVSGSFGELTFNISDDPAWAGYLFVGYCVKAGSINQGDGPEFIEVDPPASTITFGHSSEKNISHYMLFLIEDPTTIQEDPQWCSPGFWRNNPLRVAQTGVDMSTLYSAIFGSSPARSPQGVRSGAPVHPTLQQVLNSPNFYGGDAFNNVGDHLSLNHPDLTDVQVDGDGNVIRGDEEGNHDCPLSADASRWWQT